MNLRIHADYFSALQYLERGIVRLVRSSPYTHLATFFRTGKTCCHGTVILLDKQLVALHEVNTRVLCNNEGRVDRTYTA